MKPRVLAIIPAFFPSTVIGIAKPLLQLHLQGEITLELRLPFLVTRRAIERADVVVIGRVLSTPFARILDWVTALQKPLVYELDDNLIDVPDDIPGLGYARDPGVRRLLIDCLRAASVVRVYSPELRDRLSDFTRHARLVAGPLDWSLIPGHLPPKATDRVRLVYATSRAQDRIGALVVPPLRRALDAFPYTELTVWGPALEGLSGHPRVRQLDHVADYDAYLSRFVAEAFDIGLAPLPNDAFHRGKSNNKFREFAAAGVAGLYSDMPVYNTWVVHGRTGWLVGDGDEAWFRALEEAIVNAELRRQIASEAQRFAREHFNQQITDAEWRSAIASASAQVPPREGRVDQRQRAAPSAAGWPGRIGRLAGGAIGMVRRDGVGATASRVKGVVSSTLELVAWERQRRRLERQSGQRREAPKTHSS